MCTKAAALQFILFFSEVATGKKQPKLLIPELTVNLPSQFVLRLE
jgi:hypothetical protein